MIEVRGRGFDSRPGAILELQAVCRERRKEEDEESVNPSWDTERPWKTSQSGCRLPTVSSTAGWVVPRHIGHESLPAPHCVGCVALTR
jgi:hypothetical protein